MSSTGSCSNPMRAAGTGDGFPTPAAPGNNGRHGASIEPLAAGRALFPSPVEAGLVVLNRDMTNKRPLQLRQRGHISHFLLPVEHVDRLVTLRPQADLEDRGRPGGRR